MMGPRARALVLDALVIATLHAVACLVVRASGFDHVSDDDFARVTIAQAFARAPRLDPSGTSWLPFPFWVLGSALALVGRSLAAARAASVAIASVALALPYLALRAAGASRLSGIVGVGLAAASPWSVWLGASTVPESFTASLVAAGVVGLAPEVGAARRPRVELGSALAITAACLSRYEAWPVAAVLAVTASARALRRRDRSLPTWAVVALLGAGPLAWMAWNAHAHGSFVHFFHRVSNYKRAIGEGSSDLVASLLLYPRLLVTMRADVVAGAALGAVVLARRPELRSRWSLAMACVLAQLVFLAYGNARDGAPAHHPERALLPSVFLLAAFAADALVTSAREAPRGRRGAAAVVAFGGWLSVAIATSTPVPARTEAEDRTAQIAAGLRLRDRDAARVEVTPCAYEHFALVAAFSAPEHVVTHPATHAPVTPACPHIVTP